MSNTIVRDYTESRIITLDGTEIFYKSWGSGPPVTFSHGWPLNADAWDGQLLFLAQNGFRAIRLEDGVPDWRAQGFKVAVGEE